MLFLLLLVSLLNYRIFFLRFLYNFFWLNESSFILLLLNWLSIIIINYKKNYYILNNSAIGMSPLNFFIGLIYFSYSYYSIYYCICIYFIYLAYSYIYINNCITFSYILSILSQLSKIFYRSLAEGLNYGLGVNICLIKSNNFSE